MTLNIITRNGWCSKKPPLWKPDLRPPVSNIYCCYTGTATCWDRRSCIAQMRRLQKFHIYKKSMHDIRYNFLIGGDGNMYEGRGWLYAAKIENIMTLNYKSIIIAMIGAFKDRQPPDAMFEMLDSFINNGIKNGYIKENYEQHFPR
ncbi:peptidoglycan-recognition protein LF-like [Macrosteles quadrilineatus]|uniref:peptidoglycan-recognition protein LF-like n=1 Tax=Macrosteles quadrilineatus TaxID=74068 RepID=UPI0023E228CC|nr:peptidoglycan-recognition protein LF-like [Macrosteles quadrilineatus]